MLSQCIHGLRIELRLAEPQGLRIHSLQQVCWRRDETTAGWIAALNWYQITQTHRTNLCYRVSSEMLSDPVRGAVARAHRV